MLQYCAHYLHIPVRSQAPTQHRDDVMVESLRRITLDRARKPSMGYIGPRRKLPGYLKEGNSTTQRSLREFSVIGSRWRWAGPSRS